MKSKLIYCRELQRISEAFPLTVLSLDKMHPRQQLHTVLDAVWQTDQESMEFVLRTVQVSVDSAVSAVVQKASTGVAMSAAGVLTQMWLYSLLKCGFTACSNVALLPTHMWLYYLTCLMYDGEKEEETTI